MPQWIVQPPARLGRRGAVMFVLGLLWVSTGLSTLAFYEAPAGYVLLAKFPTPIAWAWVVTGAIAMIFAFRPQGKDKWGFVALYVPPGMRFIAAAVAYGDWLSDGGRVGSSSALFGIFSWVAILILIYTISGWRENSLEVKGVGRP